MAQRLLALGWLTPLDSALSDEYLEKSEAEEKSNCCSWSVEEETEGGGLRWVMGRWLMGSCLGLRRPLSAIWVEGILARISDATACYCRPRRVYPCCLNVLLASARSRGFRPRSPQSLQNLFGPDSLSISKVSSGLPAHPHPWARCRTRTPAASVACTGPCP